MEVEPDPSPGPGWWKASDGRWYPPELHPTAQQAPPPPPAPRSTAGSASPALRRLRLFALFGILSALLIGGVTIFLVATQDGVGRADSGGFRSSTDDDDLARLYNNCDVGDMEACDDLYLRSPIGSDEEEFGSTCGNRRRETEGDCA